MGWGNCEDHYSRVAKKNAQVKPMDVRTKMSITIWVLFIIGVLYWLFY